MTDPADVALPDQALPVKESRGRALLHALVAGASVFVVVVMLAAVGLIPQGQLATLIAWLVAVPVGVIAYRGERPIGGLLARLAVVLAVAAVLGGFVYAQLGGRIVSPRTGTIEFGTGDANGSRSCGVAGVITTAPAGTSLNAAATLRRAVSPGEVVTVTVTIDGALWAPPRTASPGEGDCLRWAFPGELLTPGAYVVEVTTGTERLASGAFQIEAR